MCVHVTAKSHHDKKRDNYQLDEKINRELQGNFRRKRKKKRQLEEEQQSSVKPGHL